MSRVNLPRALLFGSWYRSDINEEGNETVEYAQLRHDGSFEFTFITFNEKGVIVEEITESGDWGLVGDIHFTLTKTERIDDKIYAADLSHDDNYQAYQVLLLNHEVFHYQHRVTNEEYMMRRVVDNPGHC